MSDIFITDLDKIKDTIQDSNLNFLIGSGASVPYFKTLGNVENWLTDLEKSPTIPDDVKQYIRASIYKAYIDIAMADNHNIRDYVFSSTEYAADDSTETNRLQNTLAAYFHFLKSINEIIYERRSNTVTKQVNIFTTNIDVFIEKTIEEIGLQYNDGFHGVFKRKFSLSNYKKSYFQKSLHYDNTSELPVFNLLKVHGSVTWEKTEDNIIFNNLHLLKLVIDESCKHTLLDIKTLNDKCWSDNNREITIEEISKSIKAGATIPNCSGFLAEYEKLQIVNPNKEKFKDTTFNKNYYEMLRMYSNELEKEATSLFIVGFSLADEHIREITIRAIKSNPTLFVFICSFRKDAKDIIGNLKKDGFEIEKHRNVRILSLEDKFNLKKVSELVVAKVLEMIKSPEPKK
jgi:hypothetical protein